ncbi:At2g23090 like protein [Chytriomyces sp. MP71]|nr:At2g23090 like protein [Chytriomyces sp. MP71]
MGGGNAQKAAMARERKAKAAGAEAKSQLKVNENAKNVQCSICRQTFLLTIREKALQEHIDSKHSGKTIADCFASWKPQ